MSEDRFWQVIELAGGSPEQQGLHRIWLELRRSDPETVLAFIDRLAEVLQRLDLRSIAKQPWRDVSEPWWLPRVPGISANGFLYARCAAVLEGKEVVDGIIANPRLFKRRWDVEAEGLLNVGPEAWEATTKRAFDYSRTSQYDYETGSNPAGGWH